MMHTLQAQPLRAAHKLQAARKSKAIPTCCGCRRALAANLAKRRDVMAAAAVASNPVVESQTSVNAAVCVPVTARSLEAFRAEIAEAESSGADVIELRLDFIEGFNPEKDLLQLMSTCKLPYIVTYRPKWEGGEYTGPEPERLATLKLAAIRGAPYVDVELKAAPFFFAGRGDVPLTTKIILSHHNFQSCPSQQELQDVVARMRELGADIAKVAVFTNDVAECDNVLNLLRNQEGPTIALAMGERGQLVRLLTGKYGGYLTFGALGGGRGSAPGQPSVEQLKGLYRVAQQTSGSKLFGIIGKPVHHSRSPLIHNTAFQHIGFDGVYVPLLVDDMKTFLELQLAKDFTGFSVTIPHKESALALADRADPLASSIGAANTLIRQEDGTLKAYNTDCSAAICAVERRLADSSGASSSGADSPLKGKTVVVLGAGGAGKALAHGAASRGADVIITNRTRARAEALASEVQGSAQVADWEDVQSGAVHGDVLLNTTSLGMVPNVETTPVHASALSKYELVFDAVYTPLETQLLKDASKAGCLTVDGLEMFVGQAADQFRLFTGSEAPVQLMRDTVLQNLKAT